MLPQGAWVKQDHITVKDPYHPMAFSVPKRNKKLEVWRRRGVGKNKCGLVQALHNAISVQDMTVKTQYTSVHDSKDTIPPLHCAVHDSKDTIHLCTVQDMTGDNYN